VRWWLEEGLCGGPLLLAAAAVNRADSFGDFVVPDVGGAARIKQFKDDVTGMKALKTTGDACKQFQSDVKTHSRRAALWSIAAILTLARTVNRTIRRSENEFC
jgi:hypothetical protein